MNPNTDLANRVDGGSCPQAPAARRRGGSGGTAPRFAWPLRGGLQKSMGIADEASSILSARINFERASAPMARPPKTGAPDCLPASRTRAAALHLEWIALGFTAKVLLGRSQVLQLRETRELESRQWSLETATAARSIEPK